jgi:hypothetical protein
VKNNDAKLNEAIAYLHGKIEAEISFFAAAANLNARMVTARVGVLLSGTWQRAESGLPMRVESAHGRAGTGEPLADVEGGEQPHGRGAQNRTATGKGAKTGKASKVKRGKKVNGIKAYWDAMTPEQRSAEMTKRLRKAQKRKEEVAA